MVIDIEGKLTALLEKSGVEFRLGMWVANERGGSGGGGEDKGSLSVSARRRVGTGVWGRVGLVAESLILRTGDDKSVGGLFSWNQFLAYLSNTMKAYLSAFGIIGLK